MNNNEPNVGIFFIIGDKIYKSSEKLSNVQPNSLGFNDYRVSHYDYWQTVCSFAPEHKNHDYDYYSRGRVVYKAENDTFYVWLDKCINDFKHQDLICKCFHLNIPNTIFGHDEHYKCAKCNERYIDVF
ncbi:MAG: hypothetical protein Q8876_06990 [Bacillota bacterium]|nr:hypothetical protein [Bacillota bacterium]